MICAALFHLGWVSIFASAQSSGRCKRLNADLSTNAATTQNLSFQPLPPTLNPGQTWQSIVTPSSSPSSNFSWSFTNQLTTCPLIDTLFTSGFAPYNPDGHVSVTPNPNGDGTWLTFWPELNSYRSVSNGPSPFDLAQNVPATLIINSTLVPSPDIPAGLRLGGLWLFSTFNVQGGFVGLIHEELHWIAAPAAGAYDRIRVAYSSDQGASWIVGGVVLCTPLPDQPQFSGNGNFGAIWNPNYQSYFIYYTGQGGGISTASSSDIFASPGSWYKYDGSAFTQPGINGTDYLLPFNNQNDTVGSSASVSWSTLLQKWVMVYHSAMWNLLMTTSTDAINWDQPTVLLAKDAGTNGMNMYPTLIGQYGDFAFNDTASLVYVRNNSTGRACTTAQLLFQRFD